MTFFTVVDLETSGLAPPAEVVEIGWCDVELADGESRIGKMGATLFSAPGGIPPEVQAVHHLRPRDLTDYPACMPWDLAHVASCGGLAPPAALIAHSCAMERQWFTDEITGGLPWICTLKVASQIWPDAPGFSNSTLRYWLELDLDPALAMPPHRAGPDAYVTAEIFRRALDHATIEDMLAWTLEPRVLPKINFGKHRGSAWADAPADYLSWIVTKSDMDEDTKWNARRELDRRRAA